MFGHRMSARTHRQQLVDELAESYGHLKLAAAHAAGGTAEKMTPTYDRARSVASRGWTTTRSAFSPLYEQARMGAADARRRRREMSRKKQSRLPALVGLLAAGAAVGAAGAVVARRRRNPTPWEEYEPMPPVEETSGAGQADVGAPSTNADSFVGRHDELRAPRPSQPPPA